MVYDLSGNVLAEKGGEQWDGKSWFAYGTSLTSVAQGKYASFVADFSGLVLTNKGIPGGGFVSNTRVYDALMDNTDGKANADLITIEAGANDANAPLGAPTDLVTTTLCGAINLCIANVLTNCPKAQVVLMPSTRGRNNAFDYKTAGGYSFFERSEALRQVALANGVYFIPFDSVGLGFVRMNANDLYNVDNIHHTELGGYNLAKGVWSYLKNIPLWYPSLPT